MREIFNPTYPRKLTDQNRYSLEICDSTTVKLTGLDRSPVYVRFGDFVEVSSENLADSHNRLDNWMVRNFAYTDLDNICEWATRYLMRHWQPRNEDRRIELILTTWINRKVSRRVNKLLYPHLVQHRTTSPWYDHQKLFFATTHRHLSKGAVEVLKDYPYYQQDFLKYRAARFVVGDGNYFNADLDQWRNICSPTGQTYRSLNLTLDQWPYAFPTSVFGSLSHSYLYRPLVQREKLILYLLYCSRAHHNMNAAGRTQAFFNLVERTTREDLFAAIGLAKEYFEGNAEFSHKLPVKTMFLGHIASLCADYTGPLGGNRQRLTKLVEDSLYEHRHVVQGLATKNFDPSLNFATALPPIALPDDPKIKFLADYAAMRDESQTMDHCVHIYGDQAKQGYGFYFHVDYEGESATVEITKNGQVRQSYGPHNRTNAASEWGKKVLAKWAEPLRTTRPNLSTPEPIHNPEVLDLYL